MVILQITSEACRRVLSALYKGMDPATRDAEVERFVRVYRAIRDADPTADPETALCVAVKLESRVLGRRAAAMVLARARTDAAGAARRWDPFALARAELRLLTRILGSDVLRAKKPYQTR